MNRSGKEDERVINDVNDDNALELLSDLDSGQDCIRPYILHTMIGNSLPSQSTELDLFYLIKAMVALPGPSLDNVVLEGR